MMAVLFFMFFGWLLYWRVVRGQWDLRIPSYQNADVLSGIAPMLREENKERSWYMKAILWVLNNV